MPYSLKSNLETKIGEVLLSKLTSSLLFTYEGNIYMLSGIIDVFFEDEEWSYVGYSGYYYNSECNKTCDNIMRFGIERRMIRVSGKEHIEVKKIHRDVE
jgi:hypothetical protein